jgi:signal transduction histidine kinase
MGEQRSDYGRIAVRAKQSFTASGMYSCNRLTEFPRNALTPRIPARANPDTRPLVPENLVQQPSLCVAASCPVNLEGEGLLHDARNLMGALGLYCDLLSMPGVLKTEHVHYAEEVRLLGLRSTAMIQRLMEHRLLGGCGPDRPAYRRQDAQPQDLQGKMVDTHAAGIAKEEVTPVSLRSIVERSSGLLRRVACGRTIEISYGVAAAVPVRVAEESVERILVNLVRNADAALTERERFGPVAMGPGEIGLGDGGSVPSYDAGFDQQDCGGETPERTALKEPAGPIRIDVGSLVNRVGDPRPWPFRRVRLTVEDAGCGMAPKQLERLVSGGRAPSRGSHGIGFRVVRELVAGSGGDLRVMSTPEIGTRVQIEWPVAAAVSQDPMDNTQGFAAGAERRRLC